MKIPCEDCITLGICISYVASNPYGYAMIKLSNKCTMVHDYFLDVDYTLVDIYTFFMNKVEGRK